MGAPAFFDEKAIRRGAVNYRVPCITTMSGAKAAADAVAARRRDPDPGMEPAGDPRGGGAEDSGLDLPFQSLRMPGEWCPFLGLGSFRQILVVGCGVWVVGTGAGVGPVSVFGIGFDLKFLFFGGGVGSGVFDCGIRFVLYFLIFGLWVWWGWGCGRGLVGDV